MLTLVLLCGCASQLSKYVRTDGAPIDQAQEKATLAQCKGEGAMGAPGAHDVFDEWRKEDTVVTACMARNGYIQAR
jgi:hypothetical protein